MKRTFLLFSAFIPVLLAWAQQYHFIYIQSDNHQPFFVKREAKIYSSAASGYLILPKISDDTITIDIGFPNNEYPEQRFQVFMAGADQGFQLKWMAEKGWALFNVGTLQVSYPIRSGTAPNISQGKKDDFTDLLVTVTGDPALKEANVVDTKEDHFNQPVKVNTEAAKSPAIGPMAEDKKQIVTVKDSTPVKLAKQVYKASEKETTQGYSALFMVSNEGASSEAVDVYISYEEEGGVNISKTELPTERILVVSKGITSIPAATATDIVKDTSAINLANPRCKLMATDNDVKKLRKKMEVQRNDDARIYEARKDFRVRCYSTLQIGQLALLFSDDASRYGFLDAAYPYAYDPTSYSSLEALLRNTYYINRFKAMLHP